MAWLKLTSPVYHLVAPFVNLRLHIVASVLLNSVTQRGNEGCGPWLCAVSGAPLYEGGEKRYTPGKICGGCPRTKSDAPRHVPIS